MSTPLHEIDKLFRDGIESRSEYPPKNLWDNIDAELDKKIAIKYRRKYRALKRNTSILVALLLGLVLYQAIKLNQHKQTTPENKAVVIYQPGQLASARSNATSLSNKDFERNIQQDNTTLAHNKVLSTRQEQDINYARRADKFKTGNMGSDVNPTIASDETGLNIQASPKIPREKAEVILIKSNDDGGGIKDLPRNGYSLSSNIFSFSKIANDDSWKKDIATSFRPAISAPVLPDYVTAKKLNNPGAGNSRFSLLIYASPNIAWTTLDDDSYQGQIISRRRNRRGGNNGGGNNGGNNGAGNTPGGTSTGNSGGGTTSGGTNGGNNGNSGGGRGGRGDDRNDIKQSESENIAYSAGVKLGYNLSKRISLQTGLNYLVNSTSIKPKLIFAGKDRHGNVGYRINCSSGYSFLKPKGSSNPGIGDSTIVSDTRNTVSYLGVPLVLEYSLFSIGRFSLMASAGAQANVLLKGKTTTVFSKGAVNESNVSSQTDGLKTAYFSAMASVTAEMRVNKNLAFTVAPTGQFGISYMNKETSVKTKPNYIGMAAGLKLRF